MYCVLYSIDYYTCIYLYYVLSHPACAASVGAQSEAERCYTGNVPCETRLLHMRPMRNPGVAWGVDPPMQH